MDIRIISNPWDANKDDCLNTITLISRRPAGQERGWGANARASGFIPRISRRPAGQERGWGAIARAV